jgi:xanthine phosphoribosyltransferase
LKRQSKPAQRKRSRKKKTESETEKACGMQQAAGLGRKFRIMEALKKIIEEKGIILPGDVLKVDNFLNHSIDTVLMEQIGEEFARHFAKDGITKVVTIESGGIAPAYATAAKLHVPLLFIKKTEPCTMIDPVSTSVFSYTKKKTYPLCVEKSMMTENDVLLFIDDFLANGEAFKGVEELARVQNAKLVGAGICIEKAWQKGHAYIANQDYDLFVLASLASLHDGKITWSDETE